MGRGVMAVVDEIFSRSREQGVTFALCVLRGGEFVIERYGSRPESPLGPAEDFDATSTMLSWSVAKSMTHAAIGILVADGKLDLDAPAPVPEWAGTDRAAITPMQLLEMRDGLEFSEDYVDSETSHCIEMLFGGTEPSHAHYTASRPLAHRPGEVFNYSSGTTNILCRIIGDVIVGERGGDPELRSKAVGEFLRTRLFEPAGMTSAIPKFDDAGDFVGSSYVYATARDFARFGELYLHDGVTQRGAGERILPEGWLDHARTWSAHDPADGLDYGRHWWMWPAFPGSLAAHGYDGQFVVVLPDRDAVIVHLGATATEHNIGLQMRLARLAEHL